MVVNAADHRAPDLVCIRRDALDTITLRPAFPSSLRALQRGIPGKLVRIPHQPLRAVAVLYPLQENSPILMTHENSSHGARNGVTRT